MRKASDVTPDPGGCWLWQDNSSASGSSSGGTERLSGRNDGSDRSSGQAALRINHRDAGKVSDSGENRALDRVDDSKGKKGSLSEDCCGRSADCSGNPCTDPGEGGIPESGTCCYR